MEPVAVVANPTKIDDAASLREELRQVAEQHQRSLLWFETSEDDPGAGQTREALRQGATTVCALGGDGTVRAVARELVGSDVALGLLPGGTGNLLARNLHNPLDSHPEAFRVALAGQEQLIDVGWVARDDDPEEIFLVMAGIGIDAETMAETSEKVKAKVGWLAYAITGARKLVGESFGVTVTADDQRAHGHVRGVLVGNCGMIQGDVELFPHSKIDDGVLDLVMFAPKGLGGWLQAVLRVVLRQRSSSGPLRDLEGRRLEVRAHHPVEAEVDGDAIGPASRLVFRVEPKALRVKVADHAD